MALSIVSQVEAQPAALPGISKSSRWSCDVFSGSADALMSAGLLSAHELTPQQGRAPGYTAFMPDGEPCPLRLQGWREPGFKAIRQQDDGTYRVEVTVAKEIQDQRRKQEKAAKYEVEQQRLNDELAESGRKLKNWRLRRDFRGANEFWEGTKAQFQAAGLGVGKRFPGEPGAAALRLKCQCPLGFDFSIEQHPDEAKRAAGIFTAHSSYVPDGSAAKEFVTVAPGVTREVWQPHYYHYQVTSDSYFGTAEALVAAGLVPHISLFPGQPGRGRMRATYRKDWTPSASASGRDWGATLEKRGAGGKYSLSVPVASDEQARRKQLRAEAEKERESLEQGLRAEREKLRNGLATNADVESFRADRTALADEILKLLCREVFCRSDGALSLELIEDSEHWNDLFKAFVTVRSVVQKSRVLVDKKHVAEAEERRKLAAARRDSGLQSLLETARRQGLEFPDSDDEGG